MYLFKDDMGSFGTAVIFEIQTEHSMFRSDNVCILVYYQKVLQHIEKLIFINLHQVLPFFLDKLRPPGMERKNVVVCMLLHQ